MADGDGTVTVVAHVSGTITVCSEVCVDIELPDDGSPPVLDIPELMFRRPEGELAVLEDEPERRERPLLIGVRGRRVDLRGMTDRLRAAMRAGERVEVHVFPDETAVEQESTGVPAR